jgi:hypothetical protein
MAVKFTTLPIGLFDPHREAKLKAHQQMLARAEKRLMRIKPPLARPATIQAVAKAVQGVADNHDAQRLVYIWAMQSYRSSVAAIWAARRQLRTSANTRA